MTGDYGNGDYDQMYGKNIIRAAGGDSLEVNRHQRHLTYKILDIQYYLSLKPGGRRASQNNECG